MRKNIESLARALANAPGKATLGELAQKHGEPVSRIADALDVLKLLNAIGALEEAPITYIDAR